MHLLHCISPENAWFLKKNTFRVSPKYEKIECFENRLEMEVDGILPSCGEKLPPVEEWLKGFRDSELVITDSFHGIVLSLINKTPFVVFANRFRGLARMKDLLELVGLEKRILYDDEEINEALFDLKAIDWEYVEKILDRRRKESSEWLLNGLKNKKRQ